MTTTTTTGGTMTRAEKIRALMDELGLTRAEAIAELRDMGEIK